MITTLVAAAAIALALPLPSVALEDPAPCSSRPYGSRGCEDYLGRIVREREGIRLPVLTDRELGRIVQRMCFGDPFPAIEAPKSVRQNFSLIKRETVPEYCG